MLDAPGQLSRSAVGFAGCAMASYDHALWALRTWLDSWLGIGHVAGGMPRQGFDMQLTQYRRPRLARGVLHDRQGALADEREASTSPMTVSDIENDALEIVGHAFRHLTDVDEDPDLLAVSPAPLHLVVGDHHPWLEELEHVLPVLEVDHSLAL